MKRTGLAVVILMWGMGVARAEEPGLPRLFDPSRHMAVDEVQPGMQGYGLTVFHGTKIEPFAVEVVSVERSASLSEGPSPRKAVVWIKCTDPRLLETGPVQGMSGSPIFLWSATDGDGPHVPGQGGRMIGAFAFGYSWGKGAYVGVQPIQQMLWAAQRKPADDQPATATARGNDGRQVLMTALAQAAKSQRPEYNNWRLETLRQLILNKDEKQKDQDTPLASPSMPIEPKDPGKSMALSVPLMVGNTIEAQALQPFFDGTSLVPMAASGGVMNGLAPKWLDADQVALEPGSVLSVPLVSGDMDLPAVGTVTDVLKDSGKTVVVGFGHSFFGEGDLRVPLGTGYVHFVQPRLSSSFKMGGTLKVVGALVNDELVGVVGEEGAKAPTRKSIVHVKWPDPSKNHTYEYEMTDHPQYLSVMAGYTVMFSLVGDTIVPPHSTVNLDCTMHFAGGRDLRMRIPLPEAQSTDPLLEIAPVVDMMTENEYGGIPLESMETTIEVKPGVAALTIEDLILEDGALPVRPGSTVKARLKLKQIRGDEKLVDVSLKLPDDLEDGEYSWVIGGSSAYTRLFMNTYPHLVRITNADELYEALRVVSDVEPNGLYSIMPIPAETNVAMGRVELPRLPSSRAAMLGAVSPMLTERYGKMISTHVPMDDMVVGSASVTVKVEKNLKNR